MPMTNRDFWEPKLAANVARDRQTDAILRAEAWTVIRVWEHELAIEAATRIEDAVRATRPAL
jgi:DNA mismatch endonuclease (patch repair protein)